MAILEVKNIHKSFGRTEVLKDVSFSLEKGQVVSIIGYPDALFYGVTDTIQRSAQDMLIVL